MEYKKETCLECGGDGLYLKSPNMATTYDLKGDIYCHTCDGTGYLLAPVLKKEQEANSEKN